MSLDPVRNFAITEVSTAYDDTATSVVLATGDGDKLPLPSSDGAFNLTWWNSTDYANPAEDPNVEIVRVTARSTDTLTVTRAQEGTAASTKNTGSKAYKLVLSITKKMIDDIEANQTANNAKISYTDSAKVAHITVTQAVNLDTMESDSVTNNAKISFDATSSGKLAGIEALAEVNNISDVNADDLVNGSDSTLHFHASDRDRANATGTQLASTISDFLSAVVGSILTGISFASTSVITASDTILSALGKLQAQVSINNAKVSNANHLGEVTGSTTLTIADNAVVTARIADNAVTNAKISGAGTRDSTTFYRGDGTFAVPAGAGVNPSVDVYNTANQSVPNSTTTLLTWNSENWDSENMHSTSVNTGRLTCVTAGKYMVTTNLIFSSNNTGVRQIVIAKNGAQVWSQIFPQNYAGEEQIGTVFVLALAVNDYVTCEVWHGAGVTLTVAGSGRSTFGMHKLSA